MGQPAPERPRKRQRKPESSIFGWAHLFVRAVRRARLRSMGFYMCAALTVATSGWLLGPHGRSAKGPKAAATRLAAQPGGGRA